MERVGWWTSHPDETMHLDVMLGIQPFSSGRENHRVPSEIHLKQAVWSSRYIHLQAISIYPQANSSPLKKKNASWFR